MKQNILFFQGGGSEEDYHADANLVASLREHLGAKYVIHYPLLPNDGTPDLGRRGQIREAIEASDDNIILVAHSLGASMLLACLSEFKITKPIASIFLLATPFWKGDEDWVKAFKLRPDFEKKLDPQIPLFFYHTRDDEEVPFGQLNSYRERIPWAVFRELSTGGHQFNNDLTRVASDITSL